MRHTARGEKLLIPHASSARHFPLIVSGAEGDRPVSIAVTLDRHLPRLTADRAILNVVLAASTRLVDVELRLFAAIGTADRDEGAHPAILMPVLHPLS